MAYVVALATKEANSPDLSSSAPQNCSHYKSGGHLTDNLGLTNKVPRLSNQGLMLVINWELLISFVKFSCSYFNSVPFSEQNVHRSSTDLSSQLLS